MPVAAEEQRAPVRVTRPLGRHRRIHPCRRHQRAGCVPKQVEVEPGKHGLLPGFELFVRDRGLDRLAPYPLAEPAFRPLATGQSREDERGPGRSHHQLFTEQRHFQIGEVDAVLAAVLRQPVRNRQGAGTEVEKVVGHFEPNPLTSPDHPGKEDETLGVFGHPGSELVQLIDGQRSPASRRMPDRVDRQHPFINAVSASASVTQYPLQELQLVLGRSRMLGCPHGNEVLDRRSPECGQLGLPEGCPDPGRAFVELNGRCPESADGLLARQPGVDFLAQRPALLDEPIPLRTPEQQLQLVALGGIARRESLGREW
jgi:hypothetical protein